MKRLVLLFIGCMASGASAFSVQVVQKDLAVGGSELVLYQGNRHAATQTIGAVTPKNLFVVTLPGTPSRDFQKLLELGNVKDVVPGEFALMQIEPKNVSKIAAIAHQHSQACGALIHLEGDPIRMLGKYDGPIYSTNETHQLVSDLVGQVNADRLRSTVEELAAMHSRHHESDSGVQVGSYLKNRYDALASGREDVTVTLYNHSFTGQDSIVVRILGSELPDEIVILGSHIDSINGRPTNRSPGADDNASGTALNLEVFQILMTNQIRPKRTIEIHGYAAEEVGLRGSADIAKSYRRNSKDVVSMLQNDMNLYTERPGEPTIWFVSNSTSRAMNDDLKKLVRRYTISEPKEERLIFGTSDHASWKRQGYHVSFPTENPRAFNNRIHTTHDTIANSGNFGQASEYTRLSLAYALHFAGWVVR